MGCSDFASLMIEIVGPHLFFAASPHLTSVSLNKSMQIKVICFYGPMINITNELVERYHR